MPHNTHQPTKHHDPARRKRDEEPTSTYNDKPNLYSFAWSRHLLNMTRFCAGQPALPLQSNGK